MVGLKRLGTETINKYNYSETKKNVDRFMEPLYELAFKYNNDTFNNCIWILCSKGGFFFFFIEIFNKLDKEIKELTEIEKLMNYACDYMKLDNVTFNIIIVDNEKIHEINGSSNVMLNGFEVAK